MRDEPIWYELLWHRLGESRPNLIVRLGLSLVLALLLLAAAVLAAWLWALQSGSRYVRDEWIGLSLAAGGIAWLWLLFYIWRPMQKARGLLVPILFTVGTALAAGCVLFLIDEMSNGPDEEGLMTAVFFAACTIVVLVWVVAFERLHTPRKVLGPDGIVQVNCPQCGYSLVGQRELRCSECGLTFTIDEIIRAQGYGPRDEGSDKGG